jgi:hypothetical protein
MRYLKTFNSLNESYQDGVDIMEAIKNTPEGRDLQKIILGYSFATSFDIKRTGRVYLKNYGSKTSVERIANGRYSITSLSNGVPFWTEYYDSIPELLRGAWSNAVAKKITEQGMKKDDIRRWVTDNINPGSELSIKEIHDRYTQEFSIDFLDINELQDSKIINKLRSIFLNDNILTIRNGRVDYAELVIDLGDSILGDVFGFKRYSNPALLGTMGTISLTIKPVASTSKNSLKLDYGDRATLKLKKSDDLDSVFSNFVIKWIKLAITKFRPNQFKNVEITPLNVSDIIISLIEGEEDSYKAIEDSMEKMAKEGTPLFVKAMEAISRSEDERIKDIHKRMEEKYSSVMRGIGIANRFGGFDY